MPEVRSKKFPRTFSEVNPNNITSRRLRSRPFVDYSSMVGNNPTSRDLAAQESGWTREWTGRKKIYNNMTRHTQVDKVYTEAVYDISDEEPLSEGDKENLVKLNKKMTNLSLKKNGKKSSRSKAQKPAEDEVKKPTKKSNKSKNQLKTKAQPEHEPEHESEVQEPEPEPDTKPVKKAAPKQKPLSKKVRAQMKRLNVSISEIVDEFKSFPLCLQEFLSPEEWMDFEFASNDNQMDQVHIGYIALNDEDREEFKFLKENKQAIAIGESLEPLDVMVCTIPSETTHPVIYLSTGMEVAGPIKLADFLASLRYVRTLPQEEEEEDQ